MIEQASHIMYAKSMDYQCTHRPPWSSTGSKRRSERRGWLNKTLPKNHVGKKGRERSPTSMATSTAGAKERKLNAYQKQIGQQHEKPGKNNERGEVAENGRAMSQTTGNETRQ